MSNTEINVVAANPRPAAARVLLHCGGWLCAYVALNIAAITINISDIAAAFISGILIAAAVFITRVTRRGLGPAVIVQPALPRGRAFWLKTTGVLATIWITGQCAEQLILNTRGSAGFNATVAAQQHASPLLVLAALLIAAPAGEEALMRGAIYPLLRSRWSPIVAALVSATIFAILHGNLVQIVLTLPLGVLLAFVYERTTRLWHVITMHAAFNTASVLIPLSWVLAVSYWWFAAAMVVVVITGLWQVSPRRCLPRLP